MKLTALCVALAAVLSTATAVTINADLAAWTPVNASLTFDSITATGGASPHSAHVSVDLSSMTQAAVTLKMTVDVAEHPHFMVDVSEFTPGTATSARVHVLDGTIQGDNIMQGHVGPEYVSGTDSLRDVSFKFLVSANPSAHLRITLLRASDGEEVAPSADFTSALRVLSIQLFEVYPCDASVFGDHPVALNTLEDIATVSCYRESSFMVDTSVPLNQGMDHMEGVVVPAGWYLPQPGSGRVELDVTLPTSGHVYLFLGRTSEMEFVNSAPLTPEPWRFDGVMIKLENSMISVFPANNDMDTAIAIASGSTYFPAGSPTNMYIDVTAGQLEIFTQNTLRTTVSVDASKFVYVGLYHTMETGHGIDIHNVKFHDLSASATVNRSCNAGTSEWVATGSVYCNAALYSPFVSANFDNAGYTTYPTELRMQFYHTFAAALRPGAYFSMHALRDTFQPTVFAMPITPDTITTDGDLYEGDLLTLNMPEWEVDAATEYNLRAEGASPAFSSLAPWLPFQYDTVSIDETFTSPSMQGCANRLTTRRRFMHWGTEDDIRTDGWEEPWQHTWCDHRAEGSWTMLSYGMNASVLPMYDMAGVPPLNFTLRTGNGVFRPGTTPFTAFGIGMSPFVDPQRTTLDQFEIAYAVRKPQGGSGSTTHSQRSPGTPLSCSDSMYQKVDLVCLASPCNLPSTAYTYADGMQVRDGEALGVFIPGNTAAESNCDWLPTVTNPDGNQAIYASLVDDQHRYVDADGEVVMHHAAVFGWTNMPRSSCKAVQERTLDYDNELHSTLGSTPNPFVYEDGNGNKALADGNYAILNRERDSVMSAYELPETTTDIQYCEMTSDGGGWQRFWWQTSDMFSFMDALNPDAVCTVNYGPDCHGRLPGHLKMETTTLLTRDQNGRTLKWRFEPGNQLSTAVWESLQHGAQFDSASSFNGDTWAPVEVLTGDSGTTMGAALTSLPLASRWMYRDAGGTPSFLLDDDACTGNHYFAAGAGMCGTNHTGSASIGMMADTAATMYSAGSGVKFEMFWREESAVGFTPDTITMDNDSADKATVEVSFAIPPTDTFTVTPIVTDPSLSISFNPAHFTITPADYNNRRTISVHFTSTGNPAANDYYLSEPSPLLTVIMGEPYDNSQFPMFATLQDTFELQLISAMDPPEPRQVGEAVVVHSADWAPVTEYPVGRVTLMSPGTGKLTLKGMNRVVVQSGPNTALSGAVTFDMEANVLASGSSLVAYATVGVDVSCGPTGASGPATTLRSYLKIVDRTLADHTSRGTLFTDIISTYTGVSSADVVVNYAFDGPVENTKPTLMLDFNVTHTYEVPDPEIEVHMTLVSQKDTGNAVIDDMLYSSVIKAAARTIHRLTGVGCHGVVTQSHSSVQPPYPAPTAMV